MINIKYCKKCKKAYDFEECPYCRKIKSQGVEDDKIKKRNIN